MSTSVGPSRNLGLLVGAQVLGGASPPIIISLGGLVGQNLATDPTLSTLPVSLYNLGLALSTLPAAWLMRRLGRRQAYLLGALLAVLSGLVAMTAILRGHFATFCLGTALAGFYGACVQSYRFAAAELVEPARRSRAISLIMLGGLAAAVVGPQLVIHTRTAFPQAEFAGSFLGQSLLALLALPLLLSLRLTTPPPPVTASVPDPALRQVLTDPRFLVAMFSGVVSYGLMAFIMTAAPLAMVAHGHSSDDATLGIQWHVLAMFAPSFFTGHLIVRFGAHRISLFGLGIIALSGLVAQGGLGREYFWASLILLGLGWNLGFIGATTLISTFADGPDRARIQSLNDFLVFGTVAVASFGAGYLVREMGWLLLNLAMLPMIGLAMLMLLTQRPAWVGPQAR